MPEVDTMKLDGYHARIKYDAELDSFRGKIFGLNGSADFFGRNPDELREEFRKSLNVYLQACKEKGIAAQRVTLHSQLQPFDVVDHLRTPEEMAAYLVAAIEESQGDTAFIAVALGDIARALGVDADASLGSRVRPTFEAFKEKALQREDVRDAYAQLSADYDERRTLIVLQQQTGSTQDQIADTTQDGKDNISR